MKSAQELGQATIDAIIQGGLARVDPEIIKDEYEAGIIIWSGNAQEQLGMLVKELIPTLTREEIEGCFRNESGEAFIFWKTGLNDLIALLKSKGVDVKE